MNVSILALLAGESHLDNGPIYVYSTHCQQQSTAMYGPKLTQTEQPVGLEQVEGADSADTADSVDLLRKRGATCKLNVGSDGSMDKMIRFNSNEHESTARMWPDQILFPYTSSSISFLFLF